MGQAHIIDECVDARLMNASMRLYSQCWADGTLGGFRTTIPKARGGRGQGSRRATTTTGQIATERRNLRLRPTPARLASHLTKTQDRALPTQMQDSRAALIVLRPPTAEFNVVRLAKVRERDVKLPREP